MRKSTAERIFQETKKGLFASGCWRKAPTNNERMFPAADLFQPARA
jgi:hypothetical protein